MQVIPLTLLIAITESCYGARILGLMTMPSRSHGILVESILRELGNRGHHVTYITTVPPLQGPIPNSTVIDLPDFQEALLSRDPKMKNHLQDRFKGMSPWLLFYFGLTAPQSNEYVMQQPAVIELINSNQEFDLIIGETFWAEGLLAGFSYKFKAPIVGIMPCLPNVWGNYVVGNPAPSSYIPDPTIGLTTNMTFFERTFNFVYGLAWDIFHILIYLPRQDIIMRKHFGSNAPLIHDILRNTSLVLVNHHYSLAFPRPYLPNMVEVGGMHVKEPKSLPEEFKKYLDESKQGVILFSMGSNLKSADMPSEKSKEILKAFARLPYNVLWKFEKEFPDLPHNVKIHKWLPQSDLLAHPNLKVFITHGGLLSTTEAVVRGVPVLGIPIFGDQPLNMKLTEEAGLGRTLQFKDITEDLLYNEIMEVTTNPRYREAAKFKSALFKDDPLPPLEKAMWWIEYVLRYNGASHLRSSAQRLSWYQLYQLDVIAVLVIGIVGCLYTTTMVVKALIRTIRGKKEKRDEEKKKKS